MIRSRTLQVYFLTALTASTSGCSSSNMGAPPDAGMDASPPGDGSPPTDDTGLPPDPTMVAPPLDRGRPTSVFDASSFLYTGDNPIQRGVDPAIVDARRVAVLRGSGFANVSRFAEGTTVRDIMAYVDGALRYGTVTQTGAQAFTIEYALGEAIGTNIVGQAASSIRVFVRDGVIQTAFPF